MKASVLVWDHDDAPPEAMGEVLCWRSYVQSGFVSSVPRYLEDHAERLRARYVGFVHDLGEFPAGGKQVVEHLALADGFSYWWMNQVYEKNPVKSPRIYDCLRLLALEEILLEKKPSGLTLDSHDRELAQAMQRLCRNLGIDFFRRSGPQPGAAWSLKRIYRALPFTLQSLLSLWHLVQRWPLRTLKKPEWFTGRDSLFLCSYFFNLDAAACAQGTFTTRYWGKLPQYLHEIGKRANWIHHFLPLPGAPDSRTGLHWLRLFNRDPQRQGCHAFLETFLSGRLVLRALRHWCRLQAVSWRLRRIGDAFQPKGSAVWLWPLLRGEWRISINGAIAINNCLWVALFDMAMQSLPHQGTGLYLCENQGWERAMLHAWRKHRHGEIIGVPHSTVPYWWLSYFDDPRSWNAQHGCAMPAPDRMAVNGAAAWKTFVSNGYPVERLVEVEALRYLGLSRVAARLPAPGSSGIDVLVLGDITPISMRNFLSLLQEAMQRLPAGYKLTFKPHPGFAVRLADYPGLCAGETSEPLDVILGGYDVSVSANTTSASVDAYIAGLPVIIRLDGAVLNLSPLRSEPGVRFVSTPAEMAAALQTAVPATAKDSQRSEYCFLDAGLPRWKRLLSSS